MKYLLLVLVTLSVSYGQVSLKRAVLSDSGFSWQLLFNLDLIVGLTIYAVSSVAWLWILKSMALSQAYPFLALTFLFVPLFSLAFLGEALAPNYYIGAAMIGFGVVLVTYA